MTQEELETILEKHKKWLKLPGARSSPSGE